MSSSLRIVVSGLVTQHPLIGGITWHYLQYLLGLVRLGHETFYFEDSGEFPYNFDGGATGTDYTAASTLNVESVARIMARHGLAERWAYRCASESTWFGLSDRRRAEVLASADLLLNVSGSLENPRHYDRIPRKVYIDTDPVITQIKLARRVPDFPERVAAHDAWFSFGESLPGDLPDGGYRWRPTRQPIVLSEWQPGAPRRDCFTTVMNWTSYPPLVHEGRTFGQKDIEFRRFLDLPGRTRIPLEMALSRGEHPNWQTGDPVGGDATPRKPRDVLTDHGWRIVDAIDVGGDPDRYRDYIRSSKGEWSVAKNAYVQGRPGWFSERSACYLASGRPVVTQDTGFGDTLPVGEGLLSFRTPEEAVAALEEVESRYDHHAEAARAVAETCFDSDRVLTRLLDEALHPEREGARGGRPRNAVGDA